MYSLVELLLIASIMAHFGTFFLSLAEDTPTIGVKSLIVSIILLSTYLWWVLSSAGCPC